MRPRGLQEPLQSAHWDGCSTCTALLCVQDYVLGSLERGVGVIPLLLDLPAAFDTVDHELLLETVERDVGLGGRCLDWLRGCLSHRVQSVAVGGGRSTIRRLVCGVPQGSVLPAPPPVLFTIYPFSMGKLLRPLALQFHLFADDTQRYLKFVHWRDASVNAINSVESGVLHIRGWMRSHVLVLNDSKTELVAFRPKSANSLLVPQTLTLGEATIHSQWHQLVPILQVELSSRRHVSDAKACLWPPPCVDFEP